MKDVAYNQYKSFFEHQKTIRKAEENNYDYTTMKHDIELLLTDSYRKSLSISLFLFFQKLNSYELIMNIQVNLNAHLRIGKIVNRKKCGYHSVMTKDGLYFEGYWNNDLINGIGKMIFIDGSSYEGELVDGIRNGFGIYLNPDGSKHIGDYKNNNNHGYSKGISVNGNGYEGEYVDNEWSGFVFIPLQMVKNMKVIGKIP